MAIELKVPDVGESVQEVQVGRWLKREGDWVQRDEEVVELETDKASLELSAPVSGVLARIVKQDGESVAVGDTIGYFDEQAKATAEQASQAQPGRGAQPQTSQQELAAEDRAALEAARAVSAAAGQTPPAHQPELAEAKEVVITPSARRALREFGLSPHEVHSSGKRLRRQDVLRHVAEQRAAEPKLPTPPAAAIEPAETRAPPPDTQRLAEQVLDEPEEIVPMSLIRRRIAQRLVQAQQQAALLTTVNEIDMSHVLELRQRYQADFQKRYQIKLGIMSFFVKAAVDALKQFPVVNAQIRDPDQIVYRNYYHIGVAVASDRGLVVPVVRHADRMSFAQIEQTIDDFVTRAGKNKLKPEELEGGTFTISNGGVFGSLLSTPIVNPPQSGVLGMHVIQPRPVARDDQIVIRPMMYVALTYDHRLIDGREAVLFLKRVKESVEDPTRMLVEV